MIATVLAFTSLVHAQWDGKAEQKAFEKEDAELNAVYKVILGSIERSGDREDFKSAQRRWVEFRDAEATSIASVTTRGGITWAATQLDERIRLTTERTRQLQKLGEHIR